MLAEHECLKAVIGGLDVVIASSTAIVGPHDYVPSRLGRMLINQSRGRLKATVKGGFEFVAVNDLVQGHLLAMDNGRAGRKYLFSSKFVSTDELMRMFSAVTGVPAPSLHVPGAVASALAAGWDAAARLDALRGSGHMAEGVTRAAVSFLRSEHHANCSRAISELGYSPTSVAEAVRQAYECFCRRGVIVPRRRVTHSTPLARFAPV